MGNTKRGVGLVIRDFEKSSKLKLISKKLSRREIEILNKKEHWMFVPKTTDRSYPVFLCAQDGLQTLGKNFHYTLLYAFVLLCWYIIYFTRSFICRDYSPDNP